MISEWSKNTIYFSSLLSTDERFKTFYLALTDILAGHQLQSRLLHKTKDIWARDYMPIQIGIDDFLEYRYDPDYLQSTAKQDRSSKTYPDLVCDALGLKTRKTDLILDGGNVVNSRTYVILTDKVILENKHWYSKKELIAKLHEDFKAEKVILTPWDRLDYLGHIDGVLRFIDEETILVNHHYRKDQVSLKTLHKQGLKTEFLQFKVQKQDKRNWAYLNFLQTQDIILVPTLGTEEDEQAMEQLGQFFSTYQKNNSIVPLRSEDIIKYGGALNCISWTLKEG